jgi:hypothetical protein
MPLFLSAPPQLRKYRKLQRILNNKAGLQTINLGTEVTGVNPFAHDAAWVVAEK